ncbi:uncharacterized protein LOC143230286 isoform X2 [Tachypleus tridentatus]|uniref:uncharacterized protein LOC143230286 isoform X2 n=1 Tax=Tachypleus tridentatus TaxID=6853 RepID=UPI003FD45C33
MMVNQGHHLEKQDVEAVVDGICQENLLEVDITHFLQMICGHVKTSRLQCLWKRLASHLKRVPTKGYTQERWRCQYDTRRRKVEYNDVAGGINKQSDDNENAEKSERDRFSDGTCASSKTEWRDIE